MSKATNKLSAAAVKNATTEGQAQRKLADGEGLTLVIRSDSKVWWMRYRFNGKERTYTLGKYPAVSLKDARAGREEAKRLIAEGQDPVTQRTTSKADRLDASANTFQAIAVEWLETVHKKTVGPTTYPKNKRRFEMHAFPKLGRRPITEIKPMEVLDVLRVVENKGQADNANRLKTLIGQVFRYAVSLGRTPHDITADLRGLLAPPDVKHYPAIVTPDEIAKLLKELHAYWGHPTVCAALRVAPYVFLRPGNLRQMRWSEIDWDAATWTAETTKNGEPLVVPLASQVVGILREMHTLNGHELWVFPSGHGRGRPMSENTVSAALNRMGFKGLMTGHGFRAMATTVLTERLGFRAEIIEMQMAHRVRDVHGRAYNRTTWLPERREMMQQWADYLDNLRTDGNVVAIGKSASK